MRVYLKNTLDESEESGAWFTIPINLKAVEHMLGKGSYVVANTELPFFLENGHDDLEELNRVCEKVESFSDFFPQEDIIEIQKKWFRNIFDLLDHVDELEYWANCTSMLEVAERMIESQGNELGDLPGDLKKHVNLNRYAEDLEAKRDFLITETSVFERRK